LGDSSHRAGDVDLALLHFFSPELKGVVKISSPFNPPHLRM
jgi:hypothetical protein